jgi:hypothetical protein
VRSAPRPRVLRSFAVAAVVVLPLLAVPSSALAEEESARDTVVGEVVQAWPEYTDPAQAAAEPLTWIETPSGATVRVPAEDLAAELADDSAAPVPADAAGLPEALSDENTDLPVGATVRVTLGNELPAPAGPEEELTPARAVLAADVVEEAPARAPATAPATTTTNRVTVVMMVPLGGTQDATSLSQVVASVDGPVADYWSEQSDGSIRVAVSGQRDWFQGSVDCSDPAALWDEAAARAGWSPGPGNHLLVHLPRDTQGCADGLAEVGLSATDGGRMYVAGPVDSIITHELGHNFGLGHSSSVRCDGTIDTGAICALSGYDDWYDVMGVSWEQTGSLNAPQADLIGLLTPQRQATIETSDAGGSYALAPVSQRTGLRGLALRDRYGTVYWLEYRSADGRDAWLGTGDNHRNLQSGVLVRVSAYGDDTSLLLDATPSRRSGWWNDRHVAFPVGTPVSLSGGEFTVTVTGVTASEAQVSVSTSGFTTPLQQRWLATGGAGGPLGEPMGEEVCELKDGGCVRLYEAGIIYWSPATGARVMTDFDMADRWWELGAEEGPLGYPVQDSRCGLRSGGCTQAFQGGSMYRSDRTQPRVVKGAIRTRWTGTGAEGGPLGYPTTDERCGLRGGGCYQRFQNGSMYWTRTTGARSVRGQMLQYWGDRAWEAGPMGYPVTDMICGLKGGGCYQAFQGGTLYKSGAQPVRLVRGAIGQRYAAAGFETGALGYPLGDEACGAGGCRQTFRGGDVAWSPQGGAHVVWGAIRDRWYSPGVESTLGYPASAEVCGLSRGGCFQRFLGGSIYWSPGSGAHFVIPGGIYDAWAAQGWERGSLGYPVAAPGGIDGDGGQRFERGRLYWDRRTGRVIRYAR